jgi:hypothetical protein
VIVVPDVVLRASVTHAETLLVRYRIESDAAALLYTKRERGWEVEVRLSGRIVTAFTPGMTTTDPSHPSPTSAERSVLFYTQDHIFAAPRLEPTRRRQQRADQILIGADEQNQQTRREPPRHRQEPSYATGGGGGSFSNRLATCRTNFRSAPRTCSSVGSLGERGMKIRSRFGGS